MISAAFYLQPGGVLKSILDIPRLSYMVIGRQNKHWSSKAFKINNTLLKGFALRVDLFTIIFFSVLRSNFLHYHLSPPFE